MTGHVNVREAKANRACAAIENVRALEIQHGLQLSPAAAWVLAKMEEVSSGVADDDCQTARHPFFRQAALMDRLVAQIHDRIGKDATLTEGDVIRLTALGRIRIRLALREVIL